MGALGGSDLRLHEIRFLGTFSAGDADHACSATDLLEGLLQVRQARYLDFELAGHSEATLEGSPRRSVPRM